MSPIVVLVVRVFTKLLKIPILLLTKIKIKVIKSGEAIIYVRQNLGFKENE